MLCYDKIKNVKVLISTLEDSDKFYQHFRKDSLLIMNPCWEKKAKYHAYVPYKTYKAFTAVNYNLFSATIYTNLKYFNEDVI